MNKTINKLLKEMEEFEVINQPDYVKSILESAYRYGKLEGMKEIQEIWTKKNGVRK